MEQFIARKADILFCPAWKTATHKEEENEEEEAAGECWFDHIISGPAPGEGGKLIYHNTAIFCVDIQNQRQCLVLCHDIDKIK